MKLPEVLPRHRSRVLRGLIVGAGRWLIGSFFAPFQKIDACQRHGHRIRDFSAPCPDPTRGRRASSGGGVAAEVAASTTTGAGGAIGDAARRVRARLHEGGPRGLPRLELYRWRGRGTAGDWPQWGGQILPASLGGGPGATAARTARTRRP